MSFGFVNSSVLYYNSRMLFHITSLNISQLSNNFFGKMVMNCNGELGLITKTIKPSNYLPIFTKEEYSGGEYVAIVIDNDGDLVEKIFTNIEAVPNERIREANQLLDFIRKEYNVIPQRKFSVLIEYPNN